MVQGIAASPGIVIGKAYVLKEEIMTINKNSIDREQVRREQERLNYAVEKCRNQLQAIKVKAEKELGADKAEIFATHLMILEDAVFLEEIRQKIDSELVTAENAVSMIVSTYVEMFGGMEDEYLRERAADIRILAKECLRISWAWPYRTWPIYRKKLL